MYCLTIVTRSDMQKGNFTPSYVYCERSGMPYMRPVDGRQLGNLYLFGEITGHDDLIQFYTNYRRHYRNGEESRLFSVVGALFWYECDKRGNFKKNHIWIKNIPETKTDDIRDARRKDFDKAIAKSKTTKNILIREPDGIEIKDVLLKK